MINTTKLKDEHVKTVRAMIAHFNGVSLLTRKQLHIGYLAIKGWGSSTPYFISKNKAARPEGITRGLFELKNLLPENEVIAPAKKKRAPRKPRVRKSNDATPEVLNEVLAPEVAEQPALEA